MKKKIIALFLLISSYFLFALPVFAQTKLKDSGCLFKNTDVSTLDCIPIILGNVVFWLLVFAGIVALILIIISGAKFITSGGDPKQAEGARKTLTYAMIGLVVILISFAIIAFIGKTTGVTCIQDFGFTNCQSAGRDKVCTKASDCRDPGDPSSHYICSAGKCVFLP